MKPVFALFLKLDREAYIWILGLLCLALMAPDARDHFSLCVFKSLGFELCPGCGLGRSIAYLFESEFSQSFQTHPLGSFAIMVLAGRIVSLVMKALDIKR